MNAPLQKPWATIDDLMRYDGKAELINGKIVPIVGAGRQPHRVAFHIASDLHAWSQLYPGGGEAYCDGMIFAVKGLTSGRRSFTPDAAFAFGPFPANAMGANDRAPEIAVEVRGENDYGPAQDREYAAKRADYFEAGTLVVWDVDPLARTVTCYRAAEPLTPQVFGPGEEADAEPALPGWRVAVDRIMF